MFRNYSGRTFLWRAFPSHPTVGFEDDYGKRSGERDKQILKVSGRSKMEVLKEEGVFKFG